MSLNGNSVSAAAFLATRNAVKPTAPAQRAQRAGRPVVPAFTNVARKFGNDTTSPQRYDHSYLNDEPLSLTTTRGCTTLAGGRESPTFMPTPPQQPLTPMASTARSPVQRVLPVLDGHSTFDGRTPPRPLVDPCQLYPREAQPSRPLAAFTSTVISQPEASDDEYLSVANGTISGTTTEDLSLDQLAQMFGAARLELDAASNAFGPATTDPISLLMKPEEVEDPRESAFLEAWRDIVAHDQLEPLRKRLCGFAGIGRLSAVQIVHELDAIAGSIADGSLNREHVDYSVKRKDHEILIQSIRDSLVSVQWRTTTHDAFDHFLVLLGKQCT